MFHHFLDFCKSYTTTSVIIRIVLAVLCGGLIGLERGRHRRPAGLRTHILVSLGAAICVIVGLYATEVLGYTNDPLRIGSQVVSGIGFLGVGSILVVGKNHVRGLTTAAGLWATASIGLACGIGYVEVAMIATIIVLITMTVLSRVENNSKFESTRRRYYMELSDITMLNSLIEELRKVYEVTDLSVTIARSGTTGNIGIEFVAPMLFKNSPKETITDLQLREGIVMAVESY